MLIKKNVISWFLFILGHWSSWDALSLLLKLAIAINLVHTIFIIYWVEWVWVSVLAIVQLLSHVPLFATPWGAVCQVSPSSIISQSLLRFVSIESVILSNILGTSKSSILQLNYLILYVLKMEDFCSDLSCCCSWGDAQTPKHNFLHKLTRCSCN